MSRISQLKHITILGAVVNLLLSALKLLAGIFGASAAMIADAVHSLSDLISDGVVLVMVHLGGQDADAEHDFGHGKFETLGTLLVAVLLIAVGISLCYHGIQEISSILNPQSSILSSPSGGGRVGAPSWMAFWAALISIVVKEALYQWTYRVGKKLDSPVVMANAWHHRTDALSSVAALIGIGGAILLGGKWVILDPIVCVLISAFIVYIAIKMMVPAVSELLDASLPEAIEHEIETITLGVEGVEDIHELKTRRSGPEMLASLHLVVDGNISVHAAHDIATAVEHALRQRFGKMQISIHIEPSIDAQ